MPTKNNWLTLFQDQTYTTLCILYRTSQQFNNCGQVEKIGKYASGLKQLLSSCQCEEN